MAVDLTIQGYFWPVRGLVRFSVRKTGVFSWALPTKRMPSVPWNWARYSRATSSLRCPLAKVSRGICWRRTKSSTAATKSLLMGSMRADEAKVCPRWKRKNEATAASCCSLGWETLRYMRSMPSTSRVTWCRMTSAIVRGRLMGGSGRRGPLRTDQPHRGSIGDAQAYPALGTTGALLHLVGLRRSLVRQDGREPG